jgi:hypothetical protein
MKILLYGEYSGVHTNLRTGLMRLGHDVDLITTGDGFKNIPSSIKLESRSGGTVKKIKCDLLNGLKIIKSIQDYDIVQFIHPRPGVVSPKFYYESAIIKHIITRSARSYYYACGCDSLTHSIFKVNQKYFKSFCDGCKIDNNINHCPHENSINKASDSFFINLIDGIISGGSGAYGKTYENHKKYLGSINFPVEIPEELMPKPKSSSAIRMLHGINRYYTKGSDHILPELKNFSAISGVEYNVVYRMEYAKYKKVLNDYDVLIDQLYGDILGMNALIGMAAGLIVMTSFNPDLLENPPVIKIGPTETDLFDRLKYVFEMKERDKAELLERSRIYLKIKHDPTTIAGEFITKWKTKSTYSREFITKA